MNGKCSLCDCSQPDTSPRADVLVFSISCKCLSTTIRRIASFRMLSLITVLDAGARPARDERQVVGVADAERR